MILVCFGLEFVPGGWEKRGTVNSEQVGGLVGVEKPGVLETLGFWVGGGWAVGGTIAWEDCFVYIKVGVGE